MIEKKQIELWPMYVFDLAIDYVQVVDMGTLELRITAAKPGVDGKLVKKKKKKPITKQKSHIMTQLKC